MMLAKSKADALAYGLINGLVPISEVVEWADDLLGTTEAPQEWLIDLSLCGGSDPKDVLSLLHRVPGPSLESETVSTVIEYLARRNRPFALFDRELLPSHFSYPDQLIKFSETGRYPYLPTVEFLDADWDFSSDIIEYVQAVDPAFVPFAKEDDRFTCFLSSEKDAVFIVDIVERTSARLGTFGSWLERAAKEARGFAYVATV